MNLCFSVGIAFMIKSLFTRYSDLSSAYKMELWLSDVNFNCKPNPSTEKMTYSQYSLQNNPVYCLTLIFFYFPVFLFFLIWCFVPLNKCTYSWQSLFCLLRMWKVSILTLFQNSSLVSARVNCVTPLYLPLWIFFCQRGGAEEGSSKALWRAAAEVGGPGDWQRREQTNCTRYLKAQLSGSTN